MGCDGQAAGQEEGPEGPHGWKGPAQRAGGAAHGTIRRGFAVLLLQRVTQPFAAPGRCSCATAAAALPSRSSAADASKRLN